MKFYRKSEGNLGPYRYEMVKKNGDCVFLSEDRCAIYENRPLICRFYPFTMFKADRYVFDVDRCCRGVGQGEVSDEEHFRALVREAARTMSLSNHR